MVTLVIAAYNVACTPACEMPGLFVNSVQHSTVMSDAECLVIKQGQAKSLNLMELGRMLGKAHEVIESLRQQETDTLRWGAANLSMAHAHAAACQQHMR